MFADLTTQKKMEAIGRRPRYANALHSSIEISKLVIMSRHLPKLFPSVD
ncbi:hypothetical protein [Moorena sp. SIO3F7]|nr:hypothetical protein [Moorena sp. SIO3F7]NEO10933.1 hypothetical protein [Moorena sp. SIO3E8]NEP99047.1 hypothetical protein [Moorena sp. SIO3F7]NEQ79554.1 hypothetical protein [Moorena sp. SIO2I5]